MPRDRNITATPNTDHAWSKLQRSVSHEIPRSLHTTARAIRKIRQTRRTR